MSNSPSDSPQDIQDPSSITQNRLEEIDALNALAWQLSLDQGERAIELAQRALSLSRAAASGGMAYPKGMAFSLLTLGYVERMRCEYSTALPHLLESLTILKTLSEPEALSAAFRDLGWVYFNLGDIPKALEYLLDGLKFARETKDITFETRLLITIGAVYGESGDKDQSIEALQRALRNMEVTENSRERCVTLNNLAMTQLDKYDFDAALKNAFQSLAMSRQLDASDLEALTLDTIGQIYLARQEYSLAEKFFLEAKSLNPGYGIDPYELNLNLARAEIGQMRYEEAAARLNQHLPSVEDQGVNRFIYQYHELLAWIHEKQGHYQEALRHFKRFHTIKSQLYNDETQGRLANLQIVHQFETDRIDAEIYQLKNLALRQEIAAHRLVTAELEVLATTDGLTGLLNRRHFMTLAGYTLESAQKAGQPVAFVMMDIDHFKNVNDLYGHLAGDRVLAETSATIQSCLRTGDLLGRVGGEEFVAVLPNTGLYGAHLVAERILKQVADHVTLVDTHTIQITLSMGITLGRPEETNLQSLLDRSDEMLHFAKAAGRNRVIVDRATISFTD
jgi:diguanylate cyclase (GGDEF)-like protein